MSINKNPSNKVSSDHIQDSSDNMKYGIDDVSNLAQMKEKIKEYKDIGYILFDDKEDCEEIIITGTKQGLKP